MPPVNETETSAHDTTQQEQSPDSGPSESDAIAGSSASADASQDPQLPTPAVVGPAPTDTTLGAIGKLVEEYLAQREAAVGKPHAPNVVCIGADVLFYASNSKGQAYPAKITHVHGPDMVNLHVFDDGAFPLGQHDCTRVNVQRTSTNEPNCWSWPTPGAGKRS